MKKLTIAFILTLLLALFVAPSSSAATIATETEGNDTVATADTISGGLIRGSVSSSSDIDYYKFTANKDYFEITLKVSDANFGADTKDGWNITIYDKDLNELYNFTTTSSYTTPRFPMSGTIYVKVVSADDYWESDMPFGVLYDLSFKNTTDKYWEDEYNDSSVTANAIEAGKVYGGSLNSNTDVDWFKTTSADYFNVTFSANTKIDSGYDVDDGWTISLYDSNLEFLYSFVVTTKGTSINIPVTGTVYVKVENADDYWTSDMATYVYYELKITSVTDTYWENEYNDTAKTATPIKQGKTYHGNLFHYGDVDFYSVKTTYKAFAIKFDVRPDEVNADDVKDGWKITIYPKNSSEAIWSFTSKTLQPVVCSTLPYGSGEYIIKVEYADDYWNSDKPFAEPYHISVVDKTAKRTWEVETDIPDSKHATSLKENTKIYGSLYDGDSDYYKCKMPTGGTITVKFNREEAQDDGNGYLVKVVNSSGKVIKEMTIDDAKSGKLTKVKVSKGTYYIVVTNAGRHTPGMDIIYNLSYELTMAKPTAKLSATKNTVKVSWSKRSDVAGYQIQYSTSSNFKNPTTKKITTNSTTSYTIKKASTSKAYYVRMRTFIKVDGEYRYSGWSNAVSITTTPSIKETTSTKNTLKVTWSKNSGATGYEIQCSTSKSFKNPTTKKITGNSTTNYTFKKLSANKIYYVRMRTVTKVDGKTYYSPWSSVAAGVTTPTVKKATPSKGTLKVTWSKIAGATGFQIQCSTNKDFTKATTKNVSKGSATSATFNITANKTYYVRFRVLCGSTYSPWSATYTVKAK